MEKRKKSYMKPELIFVPAGSPKYNEVMALLKVEGNKTKEKSIPPPDKQD